MARVTVQSLSEALGQSVVIDNKPGASGNVAASELIRAPADGYTFLIAPTSVETANPFLFKQTISPVRDITPVAGVGRSQMYLVVTPQSGPAARDGGQADYVFDPGIAFPHVRSGKVRMLAVAGAKRSSFFPRCSNACGTRFQGGRIRHLV